MRVLVSFFLSTCGQDVTRKVAVVQQFPTRKLGVALSVPGLFWLLYAACVFAAVWQFLEG